MGAEAHYSKLAEATLLLPDGDPYGRISLTFPPAGLTFRPPMLGDEGQDDVFGFDDDEPPSMNDLLNALSSLFGEAPQARRKPAARSTAATKKPAKKRKS